MVSAVGIHDLGLFMATVLLLNATPGVDMLLTTRNTLRHGVAAGLATALGINVGCVVHTLVAAFGLAALLAASAEAFAVVKWTGAAWLVWIAFGLLRDARRAGGPAVDDAPPAAAPTALALFRQGLLTNVLNPKIAIFFLALLPQFIDPAAADKTAAFLALGAVLVAQGTAFMLLLVAAVSFLKRRLPPLPALRRGAEGASGLLMLGLAARLALSENP